MLVNENQKLAQIIKSIGKGQPVEQRSVTPILQQLMINAEENNGKNVRQRRHPLTLKKFGTLLYIYAGSMAYEFIHRNMAEALPSLRTVQSLVHSQYSKIEEGVFQFDALVQHLRKYNSPFIVAVAEDATRIVQKVEYDPATDRCVGFVLPVDDKGLPVVNTFTANTFQEIEEMFKNRPISKYAYLYTATPLKDVPSFTLACVGTDNKFTTELVMLRWKYIQSHLAERGKRVISFAADGDSRLLSAMRSTYTVSLQRSLIQQSSQRV